MLFYFIRHGDPIYRPDSLTKLGERQAEAIAKRLSLYGLDEIYSSTSNRAILTAKPTCEILKKEATLLEFANESHAYKYFTLEEDDGKRNWIFADSFLSNPEVYNMGYEWYKHPNYSKYDFEGGLEFIKSNADEFFATLGYQRDKSGLYRIIDGNDKRIAFFAHEGFGQAFLSYILNIPYPMFSGHFVFRHSGMSVIEFANREGGFTIPRVLTHSNDSHIYKDGLPTFFNNRIYF